MCIKKIAKLAAVMTFFASASVAQALEFQGEWQQGQMIIGRTESGAKVKFAGKKVRVDDDGVFVIGLGRDAPKQVNLAITLPNGEENTLSYSVKQREYNIQRVDGVPARTVNPPAEDLERIRRESALTAKARKNDFPRRDFLQAFQWPLLGPITGVYGSQRVYNGEPRRPHFGVDVAKPTGTQVVAPANGIVTLAYDNMYFSGGTLILDHGHGITSTFIHLSEILVKEGSEIQQGDPIARVGATGRATGPHLDWRINWFGEPLDPQLVVPAMPRQH